MQLTVVQYMKSRATDADQAGVLLTPLRLINMQGVLLTVVLRPENCRPWMWVTFFTNAD